MFMVRNTDNCTLPAYSDKLVGGYLSSCKGN